MVITIWLTYALFYLGRVNFSPALTSLSEALRVSKAEVGVLGTALFWAYAAGLFINGELGSHFSPHRIVTFGLIVIIAANLLFALQTSLVVMAVLWGINGFAQSTGWPPMLRIIAERLDKAQAKRVSTIMPLSYVLGAALTWVVAGQLVAWRGWEAAFWIPGLLLIGVLLFWWRSGIDSPVKENADGNGFHISAITGEWRQLWPVLIVALMVGFSNIGTFIWLPTYVEDTGLFSPTLMAFIAAILQAIAGMGIFLARSMVARWSSIFRTTAVLLAIATAGFALMVVLPVRGQVLLFAPTLMAAVGSGGLVISSIPLILSREGRSSSVTGTINAVSNVGGGIAGIGIGAVIDHAGWSAVFALWAVASLIGMLIVWWKRGQEAQA